MGRSHALRVRPVRIISSTSAAESSSSVAPLTFSSTSSNFFALALQRSSETTHLCSSEPDQAKNSVGDQIWA